MLLGTRSESIGCEIALEAPLRHRHHDINTTFVLWPILMNDSLTIVRSSPSQSALPVFRELVNSSKDRIILFSFLYPPEVFIAKQDNLTVFDWTDRIPGYADKPVDLLENAPSGKPCAVYCIWMLTLGSFEMINPQPWSSIRWRRYYPTSGPYRPLSHS